MKRIGIIVTIVFFCLATAVFAADDITSFTTGLLKEMAAQNSLQAGLDALDIQINEDKLADAQKDAKEKDYPGGDRTDRLDRGIIVEVDPLVAQSAIETAQRKKEDNLKNLRYDTHKAALNLRLQKSQQKTEEQKLAILQDKLMLERVKLNNGVTLQSVVDDLLYQIENKKIDVETARNKVRSAEYELNRLMNRNLTDPVEINEMPAPAQMPEINLDETVKTSLAGNTGVFEKEQDLKAKTLKFELTDKEYDPEDKEYKEAKYDADKAALDLKDAKVNLEVDIRNKYQDLLNKRDLYEVAEANVQLSQKNLENMELKFKVGLVSREDLLMQQSAHLDAAFGRDQAVFDYNTALIDFRIAAGLEEENK